MDPKTPKPTNTSETSRYDYTLSEFPFCLLQSNLKLEAGEDGVNYYQFRDTITGKDGQPVERTWRIHPDPEAGFGGRTTLSTIFEIFQIWKEQGFKSRNIHFGTVNHLIERRKGKRGNITAYKATLRDLLFMAGAQYDAINAFWDSQKKAYVTVKRFKFFDFLAHYSKVPKQGQQQLPFDFIRASEILHNAVLSGTLRLDFDRKIFHKLTPLEQRLALYGSKATRSQNFIKRDLLTFARQMTITAKSIRKVRQEFRKAVNGLKEKGLPIFSKVEFEKSADGQRENILLEPAGNLVLPFKNFKSPINKPTKPIVQKEEYEVEALVLSIMDVCQDEKSRRYYHKVATLMPEQDIWTTLSEVKDEFHRGTVKNKGAIFTLKIKRRAQEQGINL